MKLTADNLWTYVEGAAPTFFDPVLSYMQDGAWFSPSFKKGHWDGRVRFIKFDRHRNLYRFATGLLPKVLQFLESKQWRYTLEDNREFEYVDPIFELRDPECGSITLRYYQQDAVQAALSHCRCIVKVATGGGKTVIGAGILNSVKRKSVWFVHRTGLLYQTKAVLESRLGCSIGIVGDSECELRDITVTMVQTAANAIQNGSRPEFLHWLSDCQVMICDESHHLSSDQQQLVVENCPATWRIGLSATPNLDGPGMALLALCGPIVVDIPAWRLIERGHLVKPDLWMVRLHKPIEFEKDDDWRTVYRRGIVENDERNARIADVMSVFKYEKRKPLVLVDQISHAKGIIEELSKSGIRSAWIHGKVSKDARDRHFDDLQVGIIDCVIATASTVGEGIDLPFLDVLCNATGKSGGGDEKAQVSGRTTLQFLGRILRPSPGKTRASYVDFVDTAHKSLTAATLDRISTLEIEGYAKYLRYWDEYVVS